MKHLEETVKLLNHIYDNPESTQRELVAEFDYSLGKVNYLVKALVEKGIVKLKRFKNSGKKSGYLYHLTPRGLKLKTEITGMFLKQKLDEYDKLAKEIRDLELKLNKES